MPGHDVLHGKLVQKEPRLQLWRKGVQAGLTQGSSPAKGVERAFAAEPLTPICAQSTGLSKLNLCHFDRVVMSPESAPKRNIHDVAKLLISRYGERAYAHAIHQALKARETADKRRQEAWRRIAVTVREVLRAEPDNDESEVG
jgi:hypothetical protein